jgi:hypothetical protein
MKNKRGTELNICRDCDIAHYNNCTTCFGYGLIYSDRLMPITAREAEEKEYDGFEYCPECLSGPMGVR